MIVRFINIYIFRILKSVADMLHPCRTPLFTKFPSVFDLPVFELAKEIGVLIRVAKELEMF